MSNKKWSDTKLLANRIILLLVVGVGLWICMFTIYPVPDIPTSTKHHDGCPAKCVKWYSNVPYVDDKELWRAIVDNKETTLNFEEWKKEVHSKRDQYAKYTYCPTACKDPDIYRRMGWY